mmetsp:Transcript_49808/g.75780  ORF Transcript_49808/g.75780 Transcript_49808/m.75780 type:complete len:156 (-) Transcript_49808:97-564(-)
MWPTLVKLCVKANEENKQKTLRRMKRELEENPECLTQRTPTGATALHMAVLSNQKYCVDFLLKKGMKPNARNNDAETPLHYAAQIGNLSVIRLLLKNGANINAKDLTQDSPCMWAENAGHQHVTKYLVRKGSNTTPTKLLFTLKPVNYGQSKCIY